jgi:hypothetical protein
LDTCAQQQLDAEFVKQQQSLTSDQILALQHSPVSISGIDASDLNDNNNRPLIGRKQSIKRFSMSHYSHANASSSPAPRRLSAKWSSPIDMTSSPMTSSVTVVSASTSKRDSLQLQTHPSMQIPPESDVRAPSIVLSALLYLELLRRCDGLIANLKSLQSKLSDWSADGMAANQFDYQHLPGSPKNTENRHSFVLD